MDPTVAEFDKFGYYKRKKEMLADTADKLAREEGSTQIGQF